MDSFQQPAFDISTSSCDFDPNLVPENGEQYLQKVVYERAKCPAVVVKPLKRSANVQMESKDHWKRFTKEDTLDTAQMCLLPTDDWLRIQTESFQRLREKVAKLRKSYKTVDENRLPDDEDSLAWYNYCEANSPLLSTMFQIQQRTLEKLIEHQSNWLTEDLTVYKEKSEWITSWIYSALACLHLPLEPNMHSILREIAKTCIRLRNQMDGDSENSVTPLNLIICIVARNFNQLDLLQRTK